MDVGFVEKLEDHKKVLYDFTKPHFFYNWVIINDKEIGGIMFYRREYLLKRQ